MDSFNLVESEYMDCLCYKTIIGYSYMKAHSPTNYAYISTEIDLFNYKIIDFNFKRFKNKSSMLVLKFKNSFETEKLVFQNFNE